MTALKDLYKDLEKKTPNEIYGLINICMHDIITDLKKYDTDMSKLFAGFIFTIVGSDGKVRPEEFNVIKPIMDALFNMNAGMDDAKELILKYGFKENEAKKVTSDFLNAIGKSNPDLKMKMLTLAIYICAVDGDVSRKERAFIESLF